MKHLDIFIHLITLLSGIITAILGFLLYAKYKIKAIRHYSFFILATNLTVLYTALSSYLANNINSEHYILIQNIGFIFFELFIIIINYSFSSFALGIINKKIAYINRIFFYIPCVFFLISIISGIYLNIGKAEISVHPVLSYYFLIILFFLFLSFIVYSILIAINLKKINNIDLKRALKILALLFIVYIPIQSLIVVYFIENTIFIFLSRNILYFLINTISFSFAAKYFFIKTPSILDQIIISENFIRKYAITDREKEVIELQLSGLSIRKISGKLGRSFKTVNNHIYNIYQKTNVSSKIELLNLIRDNQI